MPEIQDQVRNTAVKPSAESGRLDNNTAKTLLPQLGVHVPTDLAPTPADERTMSFGGKSREMFEWALEKVRGVMSPEVDRSVTNSVSQAYQMAAYALTFDFMRPGDRQYAPKVYQAFEDYFVNSGKPKQFGQYDLTMAAGWQPKDPIMVNGVKKTYDKPIDNMLAVMVRDKDGNVRVIEPSLKVNSLGELYNLPRAMLPWNTNKPEDKEWNETAGTFVRWQVMPMLLSGGAWAAGKGLALSGKVIPGMEKAGLAIEKTSAFVTGAAAPLAAANAGTGVSGMGSQLTQGFVISPKSISNITNGVANILTNPESINATSVRSNLNNAFHEFSYREGSDAKQIYIPSLKDGESPWTRMQQAVQGVVLAYEKRNNPWESWPGEKSRVDAEEVNKALSSHPGVNKAFYTAVSKHLNNQPLTNQDIFVMRVGYKLGPDGIANINPAGAESTEKTLKYTEQEKQETLALIDKQLGIRLRNTIADDSSPEMLAKSTAKAASHGIDRKALLPDEPSMSQMKGFMSGSVFTKAQIKAFVSDELTRNAADYEEILKPKNPVINNRVSSPFSFG